MSDLERTERDERAALYSSGAMTPAERDALEADVDDDAPLLDAVADLRDVQSALADTVEAVTPPPALRDRMAEIPDDRADVKVWSDWNTTDAGSLFTLAASDGAWESTGVDGVEVRRLFVDRDNSRMTAMFRMAPGTSYVPHRHDGHEECFVLSGDLHVGTDIVMHAGDYQRAPAGSLHGRQWTEGGCTLLVSCSLDDEWVEE